MPGRLFLTRPLADVAAEFGASLEAEETGPRHNIAPGQEIPVIVSEDGGRSLRMMRWGLIPVGRRNARGRPVMETIVNARSETVFDKTAFLGVGQAVVPADGWYEWTGKARAKTPWRIAPPEGGVLRFAAIHDLWRGPGGVEVAQVALVTCAPNRDVADYHHRMGVLLDAGAAATWLSETEGDPRHVMEPAPPGTVVVERAQDVDWDGP